MIRKALYIFAAVLVIVNIYLLVDYFVYSGERTDIVSEKASSVTKELSTQIDSILGEVVDEGQRLATLLGEGDYDEETVKRMIRESALSLPNIQGVTICYEPFSFSEDRRLFCPFYDKGSQEFLLVGRQYDYSIEGEGTRWYTDVRDKGAGWVEPYFARAAQDWYVDYGVPFYFTSGPGKGKVRGTITMSFVVSGLKGLIHGLSIGRTGYGIITTEEGTFLSHPVSEYVGTKSLQSVLAATSEPELVTALKAMQLGKSGQVRYLEHERQESSIFVYDTIPETGWSVGLSFLEHDLLNDDQALKRKYIRLAFFLSLLFICLLAVYYNKDYLDKGEIWKLSIISSMLLLFNLFLVGYLEHSSAYVHENEEEVTAPITDPTALQVFVGRQNTRAEQLRIPKARTVPTGLYVQRMDFEDSYNLNIAGKVWQKYPLSIVDSVEVGFTFPQMSPFAEAAYIEEAYRRLVDTKEGEEPYLQIGWDYRVTLRLNLSYRDFPLDKRHINIQLQPLGSEDHLLFTPDLSSYNFTNPSRKSGLDPEIRIYGSEVLESYFNYSLESYHTDFGFDNKLMFEEVPVLHYNIYLRRVLLNAFVTYLIPILVTLLMVFILLFSVGKTEERQGVIESMAAFFFVLIFSHIDLRKEIVTAEVIYIEYFYFITYFVLVLSTFNLITYAKSKHRFFDFNDNQIFKAIYFPLFLLLLLVVTVLKFY